MIVWLNGEFLDDSAASLPATGAGVLLGWGVFSTLGVRDGRPLAARRHLARLRRDAAKLEIEFPFDDDTLRAALGEVIARNALENGIARITLARRGDGRWNREAGSDCSIIVQAASPSQRNGLRVALSPFRLDARRALAGVKSTSYMEHQLAWMEAHERGFDEAILLNQIGAVCEASRANVFWVRGGDLFTPSLESGCLPGIGREIVLEAAAQLSIPAHQGLFSVTELCSADEVFLTSATSGPRGVEKLASDDLDCDFSAPGDVTRTLQKWWDAMSPEF